MEKCDGSLTIENKKKKNMIDELIRRGFDPDPVKKWKANQVKLFMLHIHEGNLSIKNDSPVFSNVRNYDREVRKLL